MNAYHIPAEPSQFSQEIKKSRFICKIEHMSTPEKAQQWIKSIRQEFPDARHVCWAYIAGAPGCPHQSMSDDGEPSGTAGKPMINVLQHSDVGEIATVVIRYFGGIKLGTGGLTRAYSSSVSETLKRTILVQKTITCPITLSFDYEYEHFIRNHLEQFKASIVDKNYSQIVTYTCHIPIDQKDLFMDKIKHCLIASSSLS